MYKYFGVNPLIPLPSMAHLGGQFIQVHKMSPTRPLREKRNFLILELAKPLPWPYAPNSNTENYKK